MVTTTFLNKRTGVFEAVGVVMFSRVLRQSPLPPAGPFFRLHAAGQDLYTSTL